VAAAEYTIRPQGSAWLRGPATDLLLGAGLGYLLTLVPLLVLGAATGLERWPIEVTLALGLAFSTPHYGATLLRVYGQREDRRKYRFFTVHVSLALAAVFLLALRVPLVGALLVTLYFTWSPWHFAGQNYGIGLMFLRRRGIDVPPAAKRWLQASFFLSFLLTILVFHTHDSQSAFAADFATTTRGYDILRIGIPSAMTLVLAPLLGVVYATSIAVAGWRLRRAGVGPRELAPVALLVLNQALWFVLPVSFALYGRPLQGLAFTAVWASTAHSIQYLWVTSSYAKREGTAPRLLPYYAQVLLAGCLIAVLPGLLVAPLLGAGLHWTTGLAILIFAVINLHHFILDGAIWRLRDGRVARTLLRTEPAGADVTPSPRRSRVRPLVFSVGVACLLVPVSEIWDSSAARGRDVARLEAAAQRLAWIGRERTSVLGTLGDLYAAGGDRDRARSTYRHALTVRRDPAVVNNLAWLLAADAELGAAGASEAIALAEEALRHYGEDDYGTLDTLAAAYADAGRFEDARLTAAHALELARNESAPESEDLEARLALYRADRPYRER